MEMDCETMELDCETIETIEYKEDSESLKLCSFDINHDNNDSNGFSISDSDPAPEIGFLSPKEEHIDGDGKEHKSEEHSNGKTRNKTSSKVSKSGASNSGPTARRAQRTDWRKNTCEKCQLMFLGESELLAHCVKCHPEDRSPLPSKLARKSKNVVAVKVEVKKQSPRTVKEEIKKQPSSPVKEEVKKQPPNTVKEETNKSPSKTKQDDNKVFFSTLKSPQQYLCEICPKVFSSENGMKRHELTHNPVYVQRQYELSQNPVVWKNSTDRFICEFCGKDYQHAGHLESHLNTHTLLHQCSECPKRFSHASHLQSHMRNHTVDPDLQHKCSKCDRTFKSQAGLDLHDSRQHASSQSFKCELCESEFPFLSGLRSHQLRVHDGRGRTVLMHDLRNFSLPSV